MSGRREIASAALAAWLVLGGCTNQSPFAGPTRTRLVRINRRDLAALDEAVGAVARLEYDKARADLANLVRRFESMGDHDRAAESMFWLSYCYEKTGHKNQAEVFYRRIVWKYPRTLAARQARSRLDRLDLKRPKGGGEPAE